MSPNEVGWFAMAFSWTALFLLARQNRAGWLVGIVGDLLWIYASWLAELPSFVIHDIPYVFMRIYGWKRWR